MFVYNRQEQLLSAQKEFLDLYQYYQKQLTGLSETFAQYLGYLLRDMAAGFPDENPFMVSVEFHLLNPNPVTLILYHIAAKPL